TVISVHHLWSMDSKHYDDMDSFRRRNHNSQLRQLHTKDRHSLTEYIHLVEFIGKSNANDIQSNWKCVKNNNNFVGPFPRFHYKQWYSIHQLQFNSCYYNLLCGDGRFLHSEL